MIMNYFYRITVAVLMLCLLFACETNRKKFAPPVFKKNAELNYDIIQDTVYVKFADQIISFGNYIILHSLVENKFLQVYDKRTGEHLGGYVSKGQGPGEMSECMNMYYNKKERIVTLFDSNAQQYLIYSIHEDADNLLQFDSKKNFSNKGMIKNIFCIDENRYLLDARTMPPNKNDQRFSFVKGNGEIISEYTDFPTSSLDDYWAYAFKDRISISPDKRKMASGTYYGGVLETFEIDNSIKLLQTKYFYPIFYKDLKITEDTYRGFLSICTSDDYIFTILMGCKEADTNLNYISVFNWKGDPVMRFNLKDDLMLVRLCYNEDDHFIYAFAMTAEYDYFLVKLDISGYL